MRLFPDAELCNEIAFRRGATSATEVSEAKALRRELSLVVERRNKIGHVGDLQQSGPRVYGLLIGPDLQEVARMVLLVVMARNQGARRP